MISLVGKKITVTYLQDKKQLYFYDILGIQAAIHYAFVNAKIALQYKARWRANVVVRK